MAKFTLGAALLFEQCTGKSVSDMSNPKMSDLVAMVYAQEFWDKADRPSLEEYTKAMADKDIADLSAALSGPFSQREAR